MKKILLLFLPFIASAAILPDTIGEWMKGPATKAAVPDEKVWSEYGLQDSESAPYSAGGRKYSISAYRFSDATGAFAAFQQIRPEDAKPVQIAGTAVENAQDEILAAGNYLIVFGGYKPKPEELTHVVATVPRYAQSRLPDIQKYLPGGAEAASQRYITGPESLARFAPAISPGTAAFHFNPEGELAKYGAPGKETTIVVFDYPTMEMARDRIAHFQEIPQAVAKRSGPLIAIALNPTSADDAERLLSQVKFQAEVTVPEHVPTPKDNPINLFWNIFILCLVLAGFCVVSGVIVGAVRILFRRAGASGEGDSMISLHLSGRP